MPFTPYHFGFGVFVFALCPFIDPIAILIGTVIIDIEGILYLLFKIGVEHGYTHSLLGVIIYLIPSSFFSWIFYKIVNKTFNYRFKFNWPLSLFSSFLGLASHLFFDGCLYPEMMIFYPFSTTRGHLFGIMNYSTDVIILVSMFLLGLGIIFVKFSINYVFKKNIFISYNFSKQKLNEEEKENLVISE